MSHKKDARTLGLYELTLKYLYIREEKGHPYLSGNVSNKSPSFLDCDVPAELVLVQSTLPDTGQLLQKLGA